MSTTSTIFSQEEILELPEDFIIEGSDPFDTLTPSSPLWLQKRVDSYQETVTKSAIVLAWGKKRISSVEALNSLLEYGLLDPDSLMFFVATQHRCAKIIDGSGE